MIKYSSIMLFAALIFCLQSFGQIANRAETDTSRLLINKWVITALISARLWFVSWRKRRACASFE